LLASRVATVLAALFLVLVPTLFSVFTEWTRWSVLPRPRCRRMVPGRRTGGAQHREAERARWGARTWGSSVLPPHWGPAQRPARQPPSL